MNSYIWTSLNGLVDHPNIEDKPQVALSSAIERVLTETKKGSLLRTRHATGEFHRHILSENSHSFDTREVLVAPIGGDYQVNDGVFRILLYDKLGVYVYQVSADMDKPELLLSFPQLLIMKAFLTADGKEVYIGTVRRPDRRDYIDIPMGGGSPFTDVIAINVDSGESELLLEKVTNFVPVSSNNN